MIRRPPRPPLLPYTTLFRSTTRSATAGAVTSASLFRDSAIHRMAPIATYPPNSAADENTENGRVVPPTLSDANCTLAIQRWSRSEERTSELQSRQYLVCRLL